MLMSLCSWSALSTILLLCVVIVVACYYILIVVVIIILFDIVVFRNPIVLAQSEKLALASMLVGVCCC